MVFGIQAAVWGVQEVWNWFNQHVSRVKFAVLWNNHGSSSELVQLQYAPRVKCFKHNLLFYTLSQNFSEFVPLFKVVLLVSQLLAWWYADAKQAGEGRPSRQCQIKTVRLGYPLERSVYTQRRIREPTEWSAYELKFQQSIGGQWRQLCFFLDPKNLIAKNTKLDLEVVLEWKKSTRNVKIKLVRLSSMSTGLSSIGFSYS